MLTALALAAVLVSSPVQPGTVTTSPAVCASAGLWAEPAGEQGYVCATSDPSQLAAIAAAEQHAAPAPKHRAHHHHAAPKHHAKPRHRAGSR